MKRIAIFFVLLASMVLLMAGCSVPKKQTSAADTFDVRQVVAKKLVDDDRKLHMTSN
jgi:uncharacterized protein YceK